MKVSILGWYNHHNIGDEAMLEGIEYLCEKQYGPCEFQVFSDIDIETVQKFVEKINQSDLFILGGGELINRSFLFINQPAWDKDIKVRKIIVGCGLNNPDYASLQDHVKRSLRRFDYIGVRDKTALALLQQDPVLAPKVYLSFGPSIALASKHGITWKPMQGVAAVIPTDRTDDKRQWDEGILITNGIEHTKAHLKQQLLNDHVRLVVLVAFGGDDNDDYANCKQLEAYLKDTFTVRIVKPATPKEALEILSVCSKVYSYRLHGMVLAYSLGIPFDVYGYHRKVKRVYDTLIQLPLRQVLKTIDRPDGWFADDQGTFYLRAVQRHPGGVIVELGTHLGRSLSYVLDCCREMNMKLYAVDLWFDYHNGRPGDTDRWERFNRNLEKLGGIGYVNVLRMDSVEAAKNFQDETVDLILLDTSHQYEATKAEINAWYPKLKTGGELLFHDYSPDFPGVVQAVNERFGKPDHVSNIIASIVKKTA
jgi:polysaccharide pyruvyl transferase WcaK-like protein